ncbi:MAG: FtsK/SpoIIIE domain-containing protein, partial [Gammaproteobacteria bacterium]|nr:FtsK/SpoIIIE domain-containing protein [Gammaproteobacteria bacterium]
ENERFVWQDEIFRQFELTIDSPPAEEVLTKVMHVVGEIGKNSTRVEVPFETIVPEANQYWTQNSSNELCVPIGRTGATRLQYLRLGRGVAQHMLIAGKTGSGKSTLFHVIVTNLALWYSPDEVELYLIDFKKGVEFKTYATHNLAHARTVAIESDREFGLSILQRVDSEMTRRGNLFRQAHVQDLASYRQATGNKLPRTVLIVDEFQVFFSEDDKLAQDAAMLLEQLVRQGRAFGIHVLLGSQTLGGASSLARSTLGQMAIRIALQCSEVDSQLILDDDNVAARLLSRPGEAIYNDAGGMVVGNSPFQTAWLPDRSREEYLTRISELADDRSAPREPLIVFEGNVPANIIANRQLAACLEKPCWPTTTTTPCIWLGEPVAIKDPTAVVFRRQSGSNLLIIGQRGANALGLMSAALLSLAAQYDTESAQFIIFDGSPADSPHAGELKRVASALPHFHRIVEWRNVTEVIGDLVAQTQSRQQTDHLDGPAVYVMVYALQRYRVLRRNEDEFSFSTEEETSPRLDKQFAELLREGPSVGVHTLVWADTMATIERTFARQTIREFDNRVLFQMSASDSSNLIDSPIANKLGLYRALFCSEERGELEKFRPYAPINPKWMEQVRDLLKSKSIERE